MGIKGTLWALHSPQLLQSASIPEVFLHVMQVGRVGENPRTRVSAQCSPLALNTGREERVSEKTLVKMHERCVSVSE